MQQKKGFYPNEAKGQQEFVIRTTKCYDVFHYFEGNRDINEPHYKRLKKSFETEAIFSPILVNEYLEIIDGQHRFEVIRELGLPLHYVVINGCGLPQIHLLNSTVQVWKPNDYIDGYFELGYPEYIKYKMFMEKYGIKYHEIAITLLNQGSSPKLAREKMKNGEYKITSYKKGEEIAEALQKIKPYYQGIYRISFVIAFTEVCKIKKFSVSEFIKKLKYNSFLLKDVAKKDQYVEIISEIYNYKNRDKMNFKYELDEIAKAEK